MKAIEDDIIIHPGRGSHENPIPPCGIFLVNPTEARTGIKELLDRGGEQRFLFHSGLVVSPDSDFFVAGPALGAPMAVMTLEKLIALGASSVVMAGWCGAIDSSLRVGDVLLGGAGYPGEGTSRYYSTGEAHHPSIRLCAGLQKALELAPARPIWSTDAPFRESRPMLEALARRHSIAGVDMEYSALCAVAAFRNIDFAGLFLVSDELWRSDWQAGFTTKNFKKKSRAEIDRLMRHIVAISNFEES
ncbi:MAG: hypothetical protein ABFR63_11395 [Thermodesulfobacteriota bacterium]